MPRLDKRVQLPARLTPAERRLVALILTLLNEVRQAVGFPPLTEQDVTDWLKTHEDA